MVRCAPSVLMLHSFSRDGCSACRKCVCGRCARWQEHEEELERERAGAAQRLREASERYEQQLSLQRARLVSEWDARLEQHEASRCGGWQGREGEGGKREGLVCRWLSGLARAVGGTLERRLRGRLWGRLSAACEGACGAA